MPFRITIDKAGGIIVVHVEGEVDMFTSPNVRDALLPHFSPDVPGIIVDLSQVSFMDSSGIATLVEGLQWSRKEGRPFVLSGIGKTVANALSLTKLDKVFSIASSTESALEVISGNGA